MRAAKLLSTTYRDFIFYASIVTCFFLSPPLALLLGFLIALTIGTPWQHINHKLTKYLLQICVVGLGFGMSIADAISAGKQGVVFTVFSIVFTLVIGIVLGKLFKTEKKTGLLISSGTAICGGSAIAAVSPIIDANKNQTAVALGIVFILNSIALLIFPLIGNWMSLSQSQFGLWCAIAIHDTSSVVGAAQKYGEEALKIATTVKLARALWIIPLSLAIILFTRQKGKKIKIPYFIFLFILAMLINTYFPIIHPASALIVEIAKKGLVITLFLIGSSLSVETIKNVGFKPLLQGFILWVAVSLVSLAAILQNAG